MIAIIFSYGKEKQIEGHERETWQYTEQIFIANRKMRMKYLSNILSGNTHLNQLN